MTTVKLFLIVQVVPKIRETKNDKRRTRTTSIIIDIDSGVTHILRITCKHEEEDSSMVGIIEKNNVGDDDTITLGDDVTSDDVTNKQNQQKQKQKQWIKNKEIHKI